jgi:hypothetical protein
MYGAHRASHSIYGDAERNPYKSARQIIVFIAVKSLFCAMLCTKYEYMHFIVENTEYSNDCLRINFHDWSPDSADNLCYH